MEPTVVVGGALLLLMMLGGKKKKNGKVGPLKPGDKPTPLPPGTGKGPSDDLPPGSNKGHLPKNKGYRPPDDMTTSDIWISPDCQAYLIGEDWYPTVDGLDAYMWFNEMYAHPYEANDPWASAWMNHVLDLITSLQMEANEAGRDFLVFEGTRYPFPNQDFPGWEIGRFPDIYAVQDAIAEAVMEEVSPLCAEAIPRWEQYGEDEEAWSEAWDSWAEQYPAMADLLNDIKALAVFGEEPEGENEAYSHTEWGKKVKYIGARNLTNAWRDMWTPTSIGYEEP